MAMRSPLQTIEETLERTDYFDIEETSTGPRVPFISYS
jgi:hypothetical protein